jgi:hypothetical protein
MYIDKNRAGVFDAIRQQEQQLFAHLLSPDVFVQAAIRCGLKILANPLNLITLVWLAVTAARRPDLSFSDLLDQFVRSGRDDERFPQSRLAGLIDDANQQYRQQKRRRCGRGKQKGARHHPGGRRGADHLTNQAFSCARQRMPSEFWVALFVVLGERFEQLHADVVRWGPFRLQALDGTRLNLPDHPANRDHFGTANNQGGSHNAQARLVLLLLPLARLPLAYSLQPVKVGEPTMARQLLQGLRPWDLTLLDAGFISYGLLAQIQQQPQAYFCVRLARQLNLRTIQRLGQNDVIVDWEPKDSRGQWRQEGLPKSLRLRLLSYPKQGFRPLRLLTNVLSPEWVSYEQWWGLSVSEEGEVLSRGLYNLRWEIETAYSELKVKQHLEGGLRSRQPAGVCYEVAGHILYYLLVRWLLVEAAVAAGVSPLRLSFQEALREITEMQPNIPMSSDRWVRQTLLPRLRERIASHRVVERPGRSYPRDAKTRRKQKRARTTQARRKRQARERRKPPRPRPWFGDGWDLSGRKKEAPGTAKEA